MASAPEPTTEPADDETTVTIDTPDPVEVTTNKDDDEKGADDPSF